MSSSPKFHFLNVLTRIATSPFSTANESVRQMTDSLPVFVLFNGATISVIATDKQARIVYTTTIPRNPITPSTTRCGRDEPTIYHIILHWDEISIWTLFFGKTEAQNTELQIHFQQYQQSIYVWIDWIFMNKNGSLYDHLHFGLSIVTAESILTPKWRQKSAKPIRWTCNLIVECYHSSGHNFILK